MNYGKRKKERTVDYRKKKQKVEIGRNKQGTERK